MKNNYQIKKIGDICDFQNGFAFKGNLFKDNGLPVLRISNIQNNGVSYNNLVFFNKKDYKDNFDKYKVNRDDLIIAMSGATTGKLAIVDTDEIFYLNQRVGKFIPRDGLLTKYLYYFLSTKIEENLRISLGSAQPNLSTEQIKNLEIPLASLSDQKRIVEILDLILEKIEKVKHNMKYNLQNSKELFESYLEFIFNNEGKYWEEKRFEDIYDVRDGTHDSPRYCDEGFPLITSKNLKKDELDYKNIKYISEKDYMDINKRSKVDKGDVLFAMIGTIGNPVVVKTEPDFAVKNVALFKIPKNQNSYFLKYFLDSRFVINKMINEAKGTTQKFVGLGYLRDFKIKIPDKTEQDRIVKKLDLVSEQTKKLESIYKKKLVVIEELKKSILHKSFTGEL